jgi:hypothetical protein
MQGPGHGYRRLRLSKNLPSCGPAWEPGKPGSLGTDERRKSNPIYAPREGLSTQPRPPMLEGYLSTLSAGAAPRRATHVKAASHTAANAHANLNQLTGRSAGCQPHGLFVGLLEAEPCLTPRSPSCKSPPEERASRLQEPHRHDRGPAPRHELASAASGAAPLGLNGQRSRDSMRQGSRKAT